MIYLGSREGYRATESEVAALPDYREAMRIHGMYTVPPGQYKFERRVGEWQVVDIRPNPISKWNDEVYCPVQIDAILTPLDEEYHFQKY